MTKATEFQEHNALLDDPQALSRQMATDGFLFFRGLVPADETVALRREILQICDNYGWIAPGTELMDGIADPSADGMEPFCGVGVPPEAYGDVQRLESFHRFAHNPALVNMLSQLFDEKVLVHALKIARLMIPAKGNAPTPAHQDHIFIQGTKTVYTCWMPLGDCPRELGGLSVLRGSHKMGVFPVRAAEGAGGARGAIRPPGVPDRRCAGLPQPDRSQVDPESDEEPDPAVDRFPLSTALIAD